MGLYFACIAIAGTRSAIDSCTHALQTIHPFVVLREKTYRDCRVLEVMFLNEEVTEYAILNFLYSEYTKETGFAFTASAEHQHQ
jgi:hypothetical protein